MKQGVYVLVLLCGSLLHAQTSAPLPTFRAGDQIPITVTFDKKLPPNAQVSVVASIQGQSPDKCSRNSGVRWYAAQVPTENETFHAIITLDDNMASGTYGFNNISVTAPGLLPNERPIAPNDPTFSVVNKPCPKQVEIPNFTITIDKK